MGRENTMRLNHVTLPANDLAASIAFYQALGLELIVRAAPRYARFAVDDGSTLSVEVTDAGKAGDAEIFIACENVDADAAAAAARGLTFDWPPTDQSYLWRTAGLRDPAGNRIVLFTAGTNQHFPPWRLDGRKG
jgi:catechol 2,3-dioxygenase-like lactoylglutathione lyase family enzyme